MHFHIYNIRIFIWWCISMCRLKRVLQFCIIFCIFAHFWQPLTCAVIIEKYIIHPKKAPIPHEQFLFKGLLIALQSINSNFTKPYSYIRSISVAQLFWNLVQSMTLIPPCPVWNFKPIKWSGNKVWASKIPQDKRLRRVTDGYTI